MSPYAESATTPSISAMTFGALKYDKNPKMTPSPAGSNIHRDTRYDTLASLVYDGLRVITR